MQRRNPQQTYVDPLDVDCARFATLADSAKDRKEKSRLRRRSIDRLTDIKKLSVDVEARVLELARRVSAGLAAFAQVLVDGWLDDAVERHEHARVVHRGLFGEMRVWCDASVLSAAGLDDVALLRDALDARMFREDWFMWTDGVLQSI